MCWGRVWGRGESTEVSSREENSMPLEPMLRDEVWFETEDPLKGLEAEDGMKWMSFLPSSPSNKFQP